MRIYAVSSGSEVRVRFGKRLRRGLGRKDVTRPLIAALDLVQAPLVEAHKARVALEDPLDDASDDMNYGEVECEAKLRRLHGRCKALDGDRAGAVCAVGFPDGLTVALAPKGEAQVKTCAGIVKRYTESNEALVVANRAELVQLATEALTALEVPYDAWVAAKKAHGAAFDVEELRRDEHRRTIDAIFGGIREAFPGEPALQNAIVPQLTKRTRADEADVEPKPVTE